MPRRDAKSPPGWRDRQSSSVDPRELRRIGFVMRTSCWQWTNRMRVQKCATSRPPGHSTSRCVRSSRCASDWLKRDWKSRSIARNESARASRRCSTAEIELSVLGRRLKTRVGRACLLKDNTRSTLRHRGHREKSKLNDPFSSDQCAAAFFNSSVLTVPRWALCFAAQTYSSTTSRSRATITLPDLTSTSATVASRGA
jgi:hypothetical protein